MLRAVTSRALHLLGVVFIVSFVTMIMVDLIPGDPASVVLGEGATSEQLDQLRQQWNLDDPLLLRYVESLADLVRGDLGTSVITNDSVLDTILERLPVTLEIAAIALVIALVVGVPLGIWTASRANTWVDRAGLLATSLMISPPAFLTGLLLAYVFAVRLHLLPVTGWVPISEGLSDNLRSALLPGVALSIYETGVVARVLRSAMISTLSEDYVFAAHARGLSRTYVLLRHALRPSLIPLFTVVGLILARLIGGTIIVEVLFALPGIGNLLITSIQSRDFTLLQGVVVFVALGYVLVNALVDVLYTVIDPRLRNRAAA
ncbi:ABC-type transporter, integral membrane subunit (plasmid) [Pseudonocardia dioxanivorans CB1190]|uniref:ABC-type transporter, integral membrane subunit n=1 Tax=Pseudonocardia dioxanivorans (strain ATCC 55486 / DSM 44775 / JCM 13855 / CB1190) TaxID=675635 RepID=F2L719_PSEUX|nr:ABC transporter permease [Pseudonocardia dioxanivorans]AEA28992.1 ABC-type transporter, integral membrane subunit [Pseudonocardia dioxanivorans CB1190]GJF02473.1 ABC di/oligopeptide transporter inner membrane subunit [Pseudonocardia sp. D17]